ncbi:MAG TPA: hypothetical protein PLM79_18090 [Syntrophobacteraceae bacterium]|nr:hypothetical protein [Syntrophobacteraceae bacterium]
MLPLCSQETRGERAAIAGPLANSSEEENMPSTVTFFPVDNGDMTLIKLDDSDKTAILVDINIRQDCGKDDNGMCDVVRELRKQLRKDAEGRPYVDVFLLSHPDEDHCRGLQDQFHLAPLDTYNFEPPEGKELKIVIREIWSSPMVFRRAGKIHTLCEDAKAFNTEARRRVKHFRENKSAGAGDRILIIGEDENGKTDDLEDILVKTDEVFNRVNGKTNNSISMRVLGPLPPQETEELEDELSKNHSSVILQFSIKGGDKADACLYLTGGDAEVLIWEKLWERNKDRKSCLEYNLMLAPHHSSWHSLSYDRWNGGKGNPQVSKDAKSALSQARDGAYIVSSSKPIKDDDSDPPCWGAKQEYLSILKGVKGEFFCTGEYPDEEEQEPLQFKVFKEGPQPPAKKSAPVEGASVLSGSIRKPLTHGWKR